jgi:hypothetical protein
MLELPDRVEVLDAQRRVLGDRPPAELRLASRVVMDRVVGEVLGNSVGVAGVQRVVVRADVVEARADDLILPSDRGRGYTASR